MAKDHELVGEQKAPKEGPKALQCVVVTPEKIWLDERVDFVALPVYDGELGVLPGHTPLVARLGYGELRTKTGESVHRYFVDGGFAQVRSDVVTVLTHRAIPAEAVDATAAALELEKAAPRRTVSEQEYPEHKNAIDRARALVRVGRHKG
jgi:F-type H+-transporting ATPase subunit epsilon